MPTRWPPDSQPQPVNIANAFQPFSLGSRDCIGRKLGIACLRLVTVGMLWNFDVAGTGDVEDWVKRTLNVSLTSKCHVYN